MERGRVILGAFVLIIISSFPNRAETGPIRINIMRCRNALLLQDCALVLQPYQRGTYLLLDYPAKLLTRVLRGVKYES